MATGCSYSHGRCANVDGAEENREWVFLYEEAGIARNQKCVLCYLDWPESSDRCFYDYYTHPSGSKLNWKKYQQACIQDACSAAPNIKDSWKKGHGGSNLIKRIFNNYKKEKN